MTHPGRSVQVYGVYLGVSGLTMCLAPNVMLGSLGVPPTTEGYIRMLGIVVFILALYYVAAARSNIVPFFRWTVWGRGIAVAGIIGLILTGYVPPAFMGIAIADALSSVWTAIALRGSVAPSAA